MDNDQIKAYYNSRYKSTGLEAFPDDFARTEYFITPVLERVTQGGKVLDIGCGVGYSCELLLKHHYEVYGVDISDEAIILAQRKIPEGHFLQIDNNDVLPYNENFFDAITCFGVLEHVLHPERLLKESYRVMKAKGIAVFVVPNSLSPYFWFSSGTGQIYERPRMYTEWKNLLYRNGFQVIKRYKDPGPTILKSFVLKKKVKILAHKILNVFPFSFTYQFMLVTIPISNLHS